MAPSAGGQQSVRHTLSGHLGKIQSLMCHLHKAQISSNQDDLSRSFSTNVLDAEGRKKWTPMGMTIDSNTRAVL